MTGLISSVSVSSMAMSNSNVSSTKYPYVTVLSDDKVDIAMQFNKQLNCVHYNLKESNENPDSETEMEFVGATGSDSGTDEAGTSGRPSINDVLIPGTLRWKAPVGIENPKNKRDQLHNKMVEKLERLFSRLFSRQYFKRFTVHKFSLVVFGWQKSLHGRQTKRRRAHVKN